MKNKKKIAIESKKCKLNTTSVGTLNLIVLLGKLRPKNNKKILVVLV